MGWLEHFTTAAPESWQGSSVPFAGGGGWVESEFSPFYLALGLEQQLPCAEPFSLPVSWKPL